MLASRKRFTGLALLAIACAAPTAWAGTIGGTVTGLAGIGLSLQNNNGDKLAVKANGPFVFRTLVPNGAKYDVTVLQQPIDPKQACAVKNGSGVARGNVTNIAVECAAVSTSSVARFAYTANADGTVSVYAVDQATGQLHARGYADTQFQASSITVDAADRFAYVTQGNNSSVVALAINPASGALTSIQSPVPTGGQRAVQAAVDRSGHFLYVANATSSDIASFTISATGTLTAIPGGNVATGGQSPFGVLVHPSLPFLFVMNQQSSNVATFFIDSASGRLTRTAVTPVGVNALPFDITMDPQGRFIYVANGNSRNVSAFRIGADGSLTEVSGSPFAGPTFPVTLGVDPEGRFLYVGNARSSNPGSPPSTVNGFAIDQASGALSTLPGSPFATQQVLGDLVVDPSGHYIYVTNGIGIGPVPESESSVSTLAIDHDTGALSQVAKPVRGGSSLSIAVAKGASPLVFEPKFLYVGHSGSQTITAFRVNAQSGALTAVAGNPVVGNITSVAADPNGRFVYAANAGPIVGASGSVAGFSIDPTTGALTLSSTLVTGSLLSAIAIDPSNQFAYVADRSNNRITRFKVDASNGTLSVPIAADSAGDPLALAIDQSGLTAYGVNGSTSRLEAYFIARLPLVNGAQRGQLLPFSDFGRNPYLTGANPQSAAVDPTGHFIYVANLSSSTLSAFALGKFSDALTPVPGSPYTSSGFGPIAVATESSGRFVYVANNFTSTIDAFAIDALTGILNPVPGSPFATGNQPVSMSTDLSGNLLYVANSLSNDVSVYAINHTTGGLAQVPGSPFPTGGSRPVSLSAVGATR